VEKVHQDSPPKDDDHFDFGFNKKEEDQNPFHKFGKTGFLVVVWIMMVMFLTSTPEKHFDRRQLAVPIDEVRIFNFPVLPKGARINSTFSGAFNINETKIQNIRKNQRRSGVQTDFCSKVINETEKENYIVVYLQSSDNITLTPPRTFGVTPPDQFDTTIPVKIPVMFDIGREHLEELKENNLTLQLVVKSNFMKTKEEDKQEMPLMFTYDSSPVNRQLGVIFAAFTLIFLYALIIYEVKTLLLLIIKPFLNL
jgi:P protein